MTEQAIHANPILSNAKLEALTDLIRDLYPGVWEVYEHGPAYPDDYAVGIGPVEIGDEFRVPQRTVLPGPIGHHNLARYIVAVQPKVVKALLADNARLRAEVAELRQGKGHFASE